MAHLASISPLPDQRRESNADDYFFSSLPVPAPFADNGSRRSSGVPESIQEMEENGTEKVAAAPLKNESMLGGGGGGSGSFLQVPQESYEKKDLLRVDTQHIERASSEQRPPFFQLTKASNERMPPPRVNVSADSATQQQQQVYMSEMMTIIDTDQPVFEDLVHDINTDLIYPLTGTPYFLQEKSSSDELPGEASDILSAISNEECSVGSEILDKPVETDPQGFVAEMIQVV